MRKSDAIRAAQVLLGVTADGIWGPRTDAAFSKSNPGFQQQVNLALGQAELSVPAIREYQQSGGDSTKKMFNERVVPSVRREARSRGLNGDIMVAQLKLESGGGGRIPPGSNNWGGIKARAGEPAVEAMTNEFINGRMVRRKEPFKRYDTPEAFAADYVGRLAVSKRYSEAYRLSDNVMAAHAIAKAGYATDPAYAQKLARIATAIA